MYTANFFEKKINILPAIFSTTLCFAIFHVSMALTNFNGYSRYSKQDEHPLLKQSIKTLVNRQQNQEQHYEEQAQKQKEEHFTQLYQHYQQQQQYFKDHQSIEETITNLKKLKCSTHHLEVVLLRLNCFL